MEKILTKRQLAEMDAYVLRQVKKHVLHLPDERVWEKQCPDSIAELLREEEEDEKWNRLSLEEIKAQYQDAL